MLRANRGVIVALTLVVGACSYLLWSRQTEFYEATATIACTDPLADAGVVGLAASRAPAAVQSSLCVRAVRDRAVVRRLGRELERDRTDPELLGPTFASADRPGLVLVGSISTDPDVAAQVANEMAEQVAVVRRKEERKRLGTAISSLERSRERLAARFPTRRVAALMRLFRLRTVRALSDPVEIVDPATPQDAAVGPDVLRNTLLGMLFGFTLGIVAALLREGVTMRLRRAREIERELELPLLAALGAERRTDKEAFKILRRNLSFLSPTPIRAVAVTSAVPEEGKSTVALALARAHVAAGRRTLLIDCDLRRGRLADELGVAPTPGLAELLEGRAKLAESSRLAGDGLTFIPPGEGEGGPAELLESPTFHEFVSWAADEYDRVVIDTSPLLPVADTLLLLGAVDAVVVCVRASRASRGDAQLARQALSGFPDLPAGVVVTSAPARERVG